MSAIPSRLNESTFRFYEPYIAEAVRLYPVPIAVDPDTTGRSYATFSARVRDAMVSLETFQWESLVDLDAFNKLRSQRKIKVGELNHNGKFYVTIGGNQGFKIFDPGRTVVISEDEKVVDGFDLTIIRAVMTLKLSGIITNPFRFINLSPDERETLVDGINEAGAQYVEQNGQIIIL